MFISREVTVLLYLSLFNLLGNDNNNCFFVQHFLHFYGLGFGFRNNDTSKRDGVSL